ncbi:MAG: VWA domain-containing protein [Candidatus Nomurabacteria bacterium]|nr:MAG: VWA domain-containing protein [Candidatus Nomurabacteria bacterium]
MTIWMNRILPWVIMFGIGITALVAAIVTPYSYAQSTPLCHVAMVLDRSGSVGPTNERTLQAQIKLLFQPPGNNNNNTNTGLYDPNIFLAFWSFAYGVADSNYDAPYSDFVSSYGNLDPGYYNFMANLNSIVSYGGTDYEQGFGYDHGNLNPAIAGIMKKTDIIVFMTDGLPNQPSGVGNAVRLAQNAVRKLKAGGPDIGNPKLILGGIIGNADQGALNSVINGSSNNSTHTFHIDSNYSNLAEQLRSYIGNACDEIKPPVTPPPTPAPKVYNLIPSVTPASQAVFPGSGASVQPLVFSVNNTSIDTTSQSTEWSITQVVVSPGQDVSRLSGGTCAQLTRQVLTQSCNDNLDSNNRTFNPGYNVINTAASRPALDPSWGPGTKICYFLKIHQPTQNDSPTDRYSQSACIFVAEHAFVQIQGGDLRVGRGFAGGPGSASAKVYASTSTKMVGGSRKTYGSWVEYGIIAPGPVVGVASLSGYAGGFSGVPSGTCDYRLNILTFANDTSSCGNFSSSTGVGTIPDAVPALTAGSQIPIIDSSRKLNISDLGNGLHVTQSNSLKVEAKDPIGKGKMIIVWAPNANVSITGNIKYDNGKGVDPYKDISEIPQLVIIANNIYIDKSVKQIDAWLIASGAGGNISTCGDDVNIHLSTKVCDIKLLINGPVMARHLYLLRTYGADSGAGDPAEIINLPGTTSLWSQIKGGGESVGKLQTTYSTDLPPYY